MNWRHVLCISEAILLATYFIDRVFVIPTRHMKKTYAAKDAASPGMFAKKVT